VGKIEGLKSLKNVTPLLSIGHDNINLTIPRRIVEELKKRSVLSCKLRWTTTLNTDDAEKPAIDLDAATKYEKEAEKDLERIPTDS
jgi:hypothetical protein